MTLKDYESRLVFRKVSYGTFRVEWFGSGFYCGPTRRGITHNTLAIDRITDEYCPPRGSRYGYTLKQAFFALYSCTNPIN